MRERGVLVIALFVAALSLNATWAADDMAAVIARIKALEEKNADLEAKLKASSGGAAVDKAAAAADEKLCYVITGPEPKDCPSGCGCEAKPKDCRPLTISGFLDASYEYNFNKPENFTNNQRIFDPDSNGFNLHLAELNFDRLPTDPGQAGFHISTAFGTDPRVFAAQDTTGAPGSRNAQFEVVDLKEAYMEYIVGVPCSGAITIDFGKFVTWMGAEVIEAQNDMNSSRSFLFGDAIPFTHTGIRATYTPFKDKLTLGLGICNANDFIQNPMNSPTGIFEVNWTPIKWFNMITSGSVGSSNFIDERQQFADAIANPTLANPNAPALDPTDPATPGNLGTLTGRKFTPGNHGAPRIIIDEVMTFTPWDKLTFVLNGDYGQEGEALNELPGITTTPEFRRWFGGAVYAKYQLSCRWYIAGRGEYFADDEGVRTGFRQDLKEGTLTTDYMISEPLHMRFEYRHDSSNIHDFSGNRDTTQGIAGTQQHPFQRNSQNTIMMQWLYKF